MTHKELVKIAEKYLYKVKRCAFVFVELHTMCREIPDAIGFYDTRSYLIECKASRSDFLGELKKKNKHQLPEHYPGDFRYYMCPDGMIKPHELPAHWGLIYVKPDGKYRTVIEISNRISYEQILNNKEMPLYPHKFEADKGQEMRLMYSALRRLKLRGVLELIYDPATTKVKFIKE